MAFCKKDEKNDQQHKDRKLQLQYDNNVDKSSAFRAAKQSHNSKVSCYITTLKQVCHRRTIAGSSFSVNSAVNANVSADCLDVNV